MLNRVTILLIGLVLAVTMFSLPSVFPQTKVYDPAGKAKIAKELKFLEDEYSEVSRLRQQVRTKTGEFSDVDPAIYDEFETLVESDFQNTEDQLEQTRLEYRRFQ